MKSERKGFFDSKAFIYTQLHLLLLMYSFAGIFSKLASKQEFLSFYFLLFYGLVLLVLALYALAWQQLLKKLPLTAAYSNKAIEIIWSTLWGVLFFGETLTLFNILGAAIVLVGVILVVSSNE